MKLKDYVFDHNWGSYDSDETINKLMLRNQDDFMKYFFINIHRFYNAQILDNYKFRFDDGTIVEFTLEKVR